MAIALLAKAINEGTMPGVHLVFNLTTAFEADSAPLPISAVYRTCGHYAYKPLSASFCTVGECEYYQLLPGELGNDAINKPLF